MSKYFCLLGLLALLAFVQSAPSFDSYEVRVNPVNGAYDIVYVYKNGLLLSSLNTLILRSGAANDAIRVDIDNCKLYLKFSFTGAPATKYIGAYSNAEIEFVDNTNRWNTLLLVNSGASINRGKWRLQDNAGSASFAHGNCVDNGFTQGQFPQSDTYPVIIATVNTNDLSDTDQNTLSCEYLDGSTFIADTSAKALGYQNTALKFRAYATSSSTRPNHEVVGLAQIGPEYDPDRYVAIASCPNYDEITNVVFAPNNYFSTPLSLRVMDSGGEHTSGKTSINEDTTDPPYSDSNQASINMGEDYPTAEFDNGL